MARRLKHTLLGADGKLVPFPERRLVMPRRRFQMPSVERREGKKAYWRVRYGVYFFLDGVELRRQKSHFLGYCPTTNDPEMRLARNEVTKHQAERAAAKFLEKINGPATVSGGPQVRLKDFVDRWLAEHVAGLAAPSQRHYRWAVNKHVLPELGEKQMGEIGTETIQGWLNGKKLAWASKSFLRSTMRLIFAIAEDWGYWEGRNPAARVKVGKKRAVYVRRLLSDDEAEALLAELPERIRILVRLIRATGCRISEVLALEWRHLDLDKGWVRIEQRAWDGEIDVVKSQAGVREIPIGDVLAAALRGVRLNAGGEAAAGWVFPARDGRVMTDAEIRKDFLLPAAEKLGLYFKGFGFHSFRREVGTALQEHGASSIEAAVWLGHSRPAMTQRYTLVQRERMKGLARKLEGAGGPKSEAAAKVVEIRGAGA